MKFHACNAIFELLDSSVKAAHCASVDKEADASARIEHDDLLAALSDQYYQALESPHFLPEAEWVGSPSRVARETGSCESAGHRSGSDGSASIHALLSDIELLEEAFGPLRQERAADLVEHDAAPEILKLFAPPAYRVSAGRHRGAVPPFVARRDHHTLAIDSPLGALDSHSHHILLELNE
ncbi:TagK domain-containing protein [Paraburkholderia xenovorans]|uniref:TagK domain-containing protein n=1 Tax=Paraburkholderia xenovorans TaxID=36873 RepID=UPI0038B789EE